MEPGGPSAFSVPYRVAYSDCTVGNHVYYSRYIEWLERARNELFRQRGVTFQALIDQGIMLPVVSCHVDYQSAARYDEEVKIEIRVAEVGKIRIAFEYEIKRVADDKRIATAHTLHVCTDLQEKPHRVPEALRAALAA